LYFSHWYIEGPPTIMMYSPEAGEAAFDPRANTDNEQISKKRFIESTAERLLCGRRNLQAADVLE
jgi:hypothetical protein